RNLTSARTDLGFFSFRRAIGGRHGERPSSARNQHYLAGAAPAAARGPGGLDGVRPPLWTAGLPLVAPLAPPGVRRPGCHAGRPRPAGGEDALLSLRPVQQLPRLPENPGAIRLVGLPANPQTARRRQWRQ